MSTTLDKFTNSYHNWTTDHKINDSVSSEYAFYLKQKDKRLKEKGLDIEEDFEHVKDEIRGTINKEEYPYIARIEYREALHHLIYNRDNKTIKKYKEPVNIYATVLDKSGDTDEEIICPNCGHRTLRSKLNNGCPYCNTYFELPPTYPYVTSFYSVPGIVERSNLMDNVKKITFTPAIVLAILIFIFYMFTNNEPILLRLFISIFMSGMIGGLTAFIIYMTYSFTLLVKLFIEAGRSLPLLSGLRTKKKITEEIYKYDHNFSYEYFEGRLITLLRQIAFSDNYKDLSIYTGNDDLSFFKDIIDISYRGSSKLLNLEEIDNKLRLTMRVYLTNTYYKNTIRRKDEKLIVTMEKDVDASDIGHDITRVECKNCGGSFDALHYKNCPHCDTPYELVHDDWVISGIRRN